MAQKSATMPPKRNESTAAGPARAMMNPGKTKMPAPIIVPMPMDSASARPRLCTSSISMSSPRCAVGSVTLVSPTSAIPTTAPRTAKRSQHGGPSSARIAGGGLFGHAPGAAAEDDIGAPAAALVPFARHPHVAPS